MSNVILKMLKNFKPLAFVFARALEDKYIKYYKSFTKHLYRFIHTEHCIVIHVHIYSTIRKYLQWDMLTIIALPFLSSFSTGSDPLLAVKNINSTTLIMRTHTKSRQKKTFPSYYDCV